MSLFFERRIEIDNGKEFEVNKSKNRGLYTVLAFTAMFIFLAFSINDYPKIGLIGWILGAVLVGIQMKESKFYLVSMGPKKGKEVRIKGSFYDFKNPNEIWIEK